MKSKDADKPKTTNQRPKNGYFICVLSLVFSLLSLLSGCIRLTGNAGYTQIKDNEAVTKTAGFDLDSSRLIDNRGIS